MVTRQPSMSTSQEWSVSRQSGGSHACAALHHLSQVTTQDTSSTFLEDLCDYLRLPFTPRTYGRLALEALSPRFHHQENTPRVGGNGSFQPPRTRLNRPTGGARSRNHPALSSGWVRERQMSRQASRPARQCRLAFEVIFSASQDESSLRRVKVHTPSPTLT
jgi:hypothetical protein